MAHALKSLTPSNPTHTPHSPTLDSKPLIVLSGAAFLEARQGSRPVQQQPQSPCSVGRAGQNVFLTEDHTVKLADFDLAVELHPPHYKTTGLCGTPLCRFHRFASGLGGRKAIAGERRPQNPDSEKQRSTCGRPLSPLRVVPLQMTSCALAPKYVPPRNDFPPSETISPPPGAASRKRLHCEMASPALFPVLLHFPTPAAFSLPPAGSKGNEGICSGGLRIGVCRSQKQSIHQCGTDFWV